MSSLWKVGAKVFDGVQSCELLGYMYGMGILGMDVKYRYSVRSEFEDG